MKKVFALFCVALSLFGMEIRIGKGDFSMEFGLQQLIKGDFSLDVDMLELAQPHSNLFDSPFYYSFNLQLYKSDRLDRLTTFFAQPLTHQWPYFGSFSQMIDNYTPLTTPVDYKIRGIDFDLQIGYDIYKSSNTLIGIALNTGISMPYMKMYDLQKALNLTLQILDTTKTKIKTYKLGLGYYALFLLSSWSLYSKGSINTQVGSIKNDLVRSSFDVDGSYYDFELGLRKELFDNLYLSAGFTYKRWEVDDTRVKLLDIFSIDFSPIFSTQMEMKNYYIGIGYQF